MYALAQETERQAAATSDADAEKLFVKILDRQPSNLAVLLDVARLAAKTADGTQLYVKSLKEQPVGGVADEGAGPVTPIAPGIHKPATGKVGALLAVGKHGSSGTSAKLKDPSEGKVNINSASAEALMRIPHIGPMMA